MGLGLKIFMKVAFERATNNKRIAQRNLNWTLPAIRTAFSRPHSLSIANGDYRLRDASPFQNTRAGFRRGGPAGRHPRRIWISIALAALPSATFRKWYVTFANNAFMSASRAKAPFPISTSRCGESSGKTSRSATVTSPEASSLGGHFGHSRFASTGQRNARGSLIRLSLP